MSYESETETESNNKNTLKSEWKLFWQLFQAEDDKNKEQILSEQQNFILSLSSYELKNLVRDLSRNRNLINKQLEYLNKEVDLLKAKIESLRLVNGDVESAEKKLHELHNFGQKKIEELTALDMQIKFIRSQDRLQNKESVFARSFE